MSLSKILFNHRILLVYNFLYIFFKKRVFVGLTGTGGMVNGPLRERSGVGGTIPVYNGDEIGQEKGGRLHSPPVDRMIYLPPGRKRVTGTEFRRS
jgi:hypothetical protein